MSTAEASAELHAPPSVRARSRRLVGLLVPPATAVTLLALCLVVLFTPLYVHPALDAAGSPALLGVSSAEAKALSDRTVRELWLGPGTFAFPAPDGARFYDEAEAAHLRNVRLLLFGFLAVAAVAAGFLLRSIARGRHERHVWRAVARGAAAVVVSIVVIGGFSVLAFDVAFETFHRLLFPGGNWAFDPTSQRLVQLYPMRFWQLTAAAFGVLAVSAAGALWLLGRRRAGAR